MKNNKEKILLCVILVVLTIVSLIPFYNISSTDGSFHVARMQSIYNNMKNGVFLPFLSEEYLNGLGYPFLGLYPYLLFFPFALLQFIGISAQTCIGLMMTFTNIFTAYFSYLYVKNITKDKKSQYIFIILYLLCPYRISRGYYSFSINAFIAMGIIPLVLLALDYIKKEKKYGTFLLITSMTLMAYTHIITLYMLAFYTIIFTVINIKTLFKNKGLLKIVIAGISSVLLSSMIVLPTIEQMSEHLAYTSFNYDENFYYVMKISSPVNIILLIIFITSFIFMIKKHKSSTAILIYLNLLIIISATNIFPWKLFGPLANHIQGGQRLFSFLCLTTGLLFLDLYQSKNKICTKAYTAAIILITVIMLGVSVNSFATNNTVSVDISVGWGDYLPNNFIETCRLNGNCFTPEYAMSLNNNSFDYNRIDNNTLEIKNNTSEKIILPKFYYKGYTIKINGKPVNYIQGPSGMIEINSGGIKNGTITMNYTGTTIQKIAKIITLISLIVYIISFIIYRKKTLNR